MLNCLTGFLLCWAVPSLAQETKDSLHRPEVKYGLLIDAYTGHHAAASGTQIPYFVSMHRSGTVDVNLAMAYLSVKYKRVRAKLQPGIGTYMEANYAAEPKTMRWPVEANAGFQLSAKYNIWLDAGILSSPYTNETPISKDHLLYTRSLAPEYVPYYLTGAKLSVPFLKKFTGYAYLLNGWQQIRDQNKSLSVGTQLEYKPNSRHTLNWDTYAGNEHSAGNPDYRNRYFTDLYWIYNSGKKWDFTSCFYIGWQQRDSLRLADQYWWQMNVMARYHLTEKLAVSTRLEYFSDPQQIQLRSVNPQLSGIDLASASSGLAYQLHKTLLARLEYRHFFSNKRHFQGTEPDSWITSSYWLCFGLCFYLDGESHPGKK